MNNNSLCGFLLLKCAIPETTQPGLVTSVTVTAGVTGLPLSNVVLEDLLLFTSLTYLDISNNFIRFSDLSVLPALVELRACSNNISKIDSPYSGFRCLQILDLSHNNLDEAALVKLGTFFQTKLVDLNLAYNQLSVLPKEICYLQKLETLVLDNNDCGNTQLSLLGFLPSLRTLHMNANGVTKYLHHSGIFPHLISLCLCQNRITIMQDFLDLTKLPELETVDIRGNPLKLEEGLPHSGAISIPSFFPNNPQCIQFIIEDPQPDQPKPKKQHYRKRKVTNQVAKEDDLQRGSLFLTQVDSVEQFVVYRTPRDNLEEDSLEVRDWIPDFILDELYRYPPKAKSRRSRRVVNALRTTVQHPLTVHYFPTSIRKSQGGTAKRAPLDGALQAKDGSDSDSSGVRSGMSSRDSSRSSKSISNLSEAEEALAKMKQRLQAAEQNFENLLNLTNINGLQIV